MNPDSAFEILGLKPPTTQNEIEERYRILASTRHPDHGGSDESMAALNQAKSVALESLARSPAALPGNQLQPALQLLLTQQHTDRILDQRIAKTHQTLLFESTNKLRLYKRTAGISAAIFAATLFLSQNLSSDILYPDVTAFDVRPIAGELAAIASNLKTTTVAAARQVLVHTADRLPRIVTTRDAMPQGLTADKLIKLLAPQVARQIREESRLPLLSQDGGHRFALLWQTEFARVLAESLSETTPILVRSLANRLSNELGPSLSLEFPSREETPLSDKTMERTRDILSFLQPLLREYVRRYDEQVRRVLIESRLAPVPGQAAVMIVERILADGQHQGEEAVRTHLQDDRISSRRAMTRLISMISIAIAALSGLTCWFFTHRIERVESRVRDLQEQTATKTTLYQFLREILDDKIHGSWTLTEMAELVLVWRRVSEPYRGAVHAIGPRNFAQLLLDRALQIDLVTIREDFVNGNLVEYYTITPRPKTS